MLEAEGVELQEFSHKYWGNKPPNTHVNGNTPIDAGYNSPDVEVKAFCMLGFKESPGDHRSWLIDVITRSMLGKDLLKIVRPPGRRLVTMQPKSVKRYNKIVEQQFQIHRSPNKMNAAECLSIICGKPTPSWLRKHGDQAIPANGRHQNSRGKEMQEIHDSSSRV